ncbi:MAG: YkgJ family cysteine cluster protein [Vulcanimicrobiota bacterium]
MKSSPPIHFVPGLHFSCTSCGKCCKNDWDLIVTKGKVESIQKTELYAQKVREGYAPLRVLEEVVVLGTTEDGSCVFLDGTLCELHRDLGEDSKPLGCQLFPLNLVRTPDGFHVSLSHACPAVLAGVGAPLPAQREWLTRFITNVEELPPLAAVGEKVWISDLCEVPYCDYLLLETKLLEFIKDDIYPQALINWACTILEQGASFSASDFSPGRICTMLEEALELLDIFGRAIISILELESGHEERELYSQGLIEDGVSRSHRTGAAFPPFNWYPPASEMTRATLIKFVRSQIQGKRLLAGQTVVSRLLAYGTGLAIICYYLEAQAREFGSLHFSFQHLEKAFSIVEENVITHSDDLERFFVKFEEALLEILG